MKKLNAIFTFSAIVGASLVANAQTLNIPDANFKACLLANTVLNTNMDNEIQVSEAIAFSDTLFCQSLNISDATGIEAFVNVKGINFNDNQLTTLNLSQNTALVVLGCNGNQLTSLNLSQNTLLVALGCSDNQLTNLALSQNTKLEFLNCSSNQLSSLNVNANPELTDIFCKQNQITALDVTQNAKLRLLWFDENQISTINVSQNPLLENFGLANNPITDLDVSNNAKLTGMNCSGTQITSLDISNNQLLGTHIWFFDNPNLTKVNLANGNNHNLNWIYAWNTPLLNCVEVDDVAYSNSNWKGQQADITFDAQVTFSTNCSNTSIDPGGLLSSQELNVYPNPSNAIFYINTELKNYSITLYNNWGQLLWDKQGISGQYEIDLSAYSKGVYLMRVISEKGANIKSQNLILK